MSKHLYNLAMRYFELFHDLLIFPLVSLELDLDYLFWANNEMIYLNNILSLQEIVCNDWIIQFDSLVRVLSTAFVIRGSLCYLNENGLSRCLLNAYYINSDKWRSEKCNFCFYKANISIICNKLKCTLTKGCSYDWHFAGKVKDI